MVRRWVPALVLGGVWWWAVLRLVLEPAHAGFVEGAVAAGGWGLSLLPVHAAATAGSAAGGGGAGAARWSAAGMRWAGRWAGPWVAAGSRCAERGRRATKAWLRRRSGGGSGRS
ncbi:MULTISPECIES: hypothetical protein [unclassified Streptomyces]|uniref:hypothetical protein n=1 Tax=unclassified Streptomyces TaxID=2593676 RepID=UPI002E35A5D4|nr:MULTISPECIES: hypothetical protein [unclassified Streptomyces]MEE1745546.1 hypothetical protein [Streptomyces sp. JV184]